MKQVSLSSNVWQLRGYWPWVPLLGKSMETSEDLLGVTDWIPATVPGGIQYDLFRAGIIEHPYNDLNSVKCEWVERRWWVYRTMISKPESIDQTIELVLLGLDYEADIYLGGRHLGHHSGMFLPFKADVTYWFSDTQQVELRILFRGAPDEMGQIGLTSRTFTQKSRFGYKWDFSTRLVNIGVWDDVQLRLHDKYSIDNVLVQTEANEGHARVEVVVATRQFDSSFRTSTSRLELELIGPSGEKVIRLDAKLSDSDPLSWNASFGIQKPQLWYPNGYGEQPLYELQVSLLQGDRIVDQRIQKVGIRSLAYCVNEGAPDDSLPYTFIVNGRRLHIQGVNLTPLDHLYGNVTQGHYEWIVRCMRNAGINLVRVWGGGLIEKECFYSLCDREGILIWQEFIQSSSGVDNIPSQRPEFLDLLRQTAEFALRSRRSHPSLAVWSGGNELMASPNSPSTLSDTNLAMLQELVRRFDANRLFLPTSASGPVEYMTKQRGVMHDVHGHWKYQGPTEHYELYGESDCLFHSEFGVDGCSDSKSIRKFLSIEYQKPSPVASSLTWRHHGEWWDTYGRDEELFGGVQELDDYSDCSQWIQAEGLRFILEANRRRQPRCSGSIIWQLNEPWPNTSCTSLVDYFGEKKMAYYWARDAFASRHAMLDYRRLVHPPGSTFQGEVLFCNRGPACKMTIRVEILDSLGSTHYCNILNVDADADSIVRAESLSFPVGTFHSELFFVRTTVLESNTVLDENLYCFSTREKNPFARALSLNKSRILVNVLETWSRDATGGFSKAKFTVRNQGESVALHIRPEESSNAWWLESSKSFFTLFPGESRIVEITCIPKTAGGFLIPDQPEIKGDPSIDFRSWCSKTQKQPQAQTQAIS